MFATHPSGAEAMPPVTVRLPSDPMCVQPKKRKLSAVGAAKLSGNGAGERKFGSLDACLSSRHMKSKAGCVRARMRSVRIVYIP